MTRTLALLLVLAFPATAHASGVVLDLHPAVAVSASLPAVAGPGGVALPVTRATARSLELAGTIRVAGLTLRALRVGTRITARVHGRRRTVFSLDGRPRRIGRRVRLMRVVVRAAGPLARRLGRAPAGRIDGEATIPEPVPPFPRPPTASDTAASPVTWHVRESLVRYLASGEGVSGERGATAAAPEVRAGSDVPLVYAVTFAPVAAWRDAASARGLLRYRGTLRLRHRAHGIDLRLADPEVRITGDRAVAVVTVAGRRTRLVVLPAAGGPARLTAAGADLLAGFYPAGDPFGALTF